MNCNECYSYFGLSGPSLDPDVISAILGLQPSAVGRVGEKLRTGRMRTEGYWNLHDRIPCGERVAYEERIRDVLDQIGPCLAAAADLCRQHRGTIMSVGYFREYDPGFWLEAATVQRVAQLGASIQCDFYNLIEEPPMQSPLLTPASSTPAAGAPVASPSSAADR